MPWCFLCVPGSRGGSGQWSLQKRTFAIKETRNEKRPCLPGRKEHGLGRPKGQEFDQPGSRIIQRPAKHNQQITPESEGEEKGLTYWGETVG